MLRETHSFLCSFRQQFIAEWGVDIDEDAANVNGDKTVNINDVLLIQQYIAEWDVKLI